MSEKEIEVKFSNRFFEIAMPVYFGLIALAVIIWLTVLTSLSLSNAKDFIIYIIIFAIIFTFIDLAVALLVLKILKPFAKMAFLKGIIESNAEDKELIKKVCDTLAEL